MDLSRHLATLRESLTAATRHSSDTAQQAAEDIATTLEPSLRLMAMDLACEIVSEVTVELDGDVVDIRLRGGEPEVIVQRQSPAPDVAEAAAPSAPPQPPLPAPEDGDDALVRVSLRMPERLKERVEVAAAQAGVSINTWLLRAAQAHLERDTPDATPRPGRRMTGWAR